MTGVLDTAAQLASPWAYILLALLVAAEAAAFVGLVIPGESAMLLGGFLAFRGRVSLGWMMAAGAVGAVVGDSVGYTIGRRLGEPRRVDALVGLGDVVVRPPVVHRAQGTGRCSHGPVSDTRTKA